MAARTFQVSDDLNIDGRTIDLQGTTTTNQVLTYSTSTGLFTPSLETPVGTVVMYGGSTVPIGWLLCDGQQVLSSSALGQVLGTKYNTGGETAGNVRVPDFVSRLPIATTLATTTVQNTSTSSVVTHNHQHTATYGTDGSAVSLAHSHNQSGGPSIDHNHSINSDKGNHSHGGNMGSGGAAHIHNTGYKQGTNVNQFTGYSDSNHTHGLNSVNANHFHNSVGFSNNHTHGAIAATSLSHAHTHNAVTLQSSGQNTSIGNHDHGTMTVMQALFIIKT